MLQPEIRNKSIFKRRGGYALAQIAFTVFLLGALASVVGPTYGTWAEVRAMGKASEEMARIIQAANLYRLENSGAWPSSIDDLRSGDYLTAEWTSDNPWGNPYTISEASGILVLNTTVPEDLAEGLAGITPDAASLGSGSLAVYSQPPTFELSGGADDIINRTGPIESRTMQDELFMGNYKITEVGDAVDPNDILNVGTGDDLYVNRTGDVMTGTLQIDPGVDVYASITRDQSDPNQYYLNPAGTSRLDRPSVDDVFITRELNVWASQLGGGPSEWDAVQVGGIGATSACCPEGYVPWIAQFNYYDGSVCEYYNMGSQICGRCDVPDVSMVCYK